PPALRQPRSQAPRSGRSPRSPPSVPPGPAQCASPARTRGQSGPRPRQARAPSGPSSTAGSASRVAEARRGADGSCVSPLGNEAGPPFVGARAQPLGLGGDDLGAPPAGRHGRKGEGRSLALPPEN